MMAIADFSIGKGKKRTLAVTTLFAIGHGLSLFLFTKILEHFHISDELLAYGDIISSSVILAMGFYLLFMVAVLALLGLLLFYNLRYLYEGSGVVSGNDLMVYPPVSAIVEKLYVHEGEKVMPGVPLVQLDSSDVSYKLALQEVERKRKVELFRQREALVKEKRQMRERMIRLAKQRVSVTGASYRNAKAQYERQLITKSMLQQAKSAWLDARQNLEKVKLLSPGASACPRRRSSSARAATRSWSSSPGPSSTRQVRCS